MCLEDHISLRFLVFFRPRVGNLASVTFPSEDKKVTNFTLICKVVVSVNIFFPNNILLNLQPYEPPMNIRYCHLHSVDENLGLTQLGWDSSWSFSCQVMWSFSLQCRCLQEMVGVNKSAVHIGGTRVVLWTLFFTYTVIYTSFNWQQGEHILAALSYPSFSTSTLKLKAASERKRG